MRIPIALLLGITGAGFAGYLNACGSSVQSGSDYDVDGGEGGARHPFDAGSMKETGVLRQRDTGSSKKADAGTDAKGNEEAVTLSDLVLLPANETIVVTGGSSATVAYKVMAVVNNTPPAQDVTDRFVFYVPPEPPTAPNDFLIGEFPADGGPTLTTPPAITPAQPQQGGTLTVQAQGYNPGLTPDAGPIPITLTTQLTVKLTAQLNGPITPVDAPDGGAVSDAGAVPANAGSLFGGPVNTAYAPTIAYPNNGVMLPPNLKFLEVHWIRPRGRRSTRCRSRARRRASSTTSAAAACRTVCSRPPRAASSSTRRGTPTSRSRTRAAETSRSRSRGPTARGRRGDVVDLQDPVRGAARQRRRLLLGRQRHPDHAVRLRRDGATPEVFLAPGEYGHDGTCIGCHALSRGRDEDRRVARTGRAAACSSTSTTSRSPGDAGAAQHELPTIAANRRTTSSSRRSTRLGDQFVAVYGDGNTSENATIPSQPDTNLWFHDGNTGKIISDEAALVRAGPPLLVARRDDDRDDARRRANTSQREYLGGIDVATFAASVMTRSGRGRRRAGESGRHRSEQRHDGTAAINSYNPSFAPDSSFLVFSQTNTARSSRTVAATRTATATSPST